MVTASLCAAWVPDAVAASRDRGPTATSSASKVRRCGISGKERRLGASYVLKLRVRRYSCRSGERVVRSYHRCRKASRRNRCTKRIRRFRCRERRLRSASTQYDARVTCRRAGKRLVSFDYTQFR